MKKLIYEEELRAGRIQPYVDYEELGIRQSVSSKLSDNPEIKGVCSRGSDFFIKMPQWAESRVSVIDHCKFANSDWNVDYTYIGRQ